MSQDTFESLEIADKRTLRERINSMMINYIAQGGVITQCEPPTYQHLLNGHKRKIARGEKKAPTRNWGSL